LKQEHTLGIQMIYSETKSEDDAPQRIWSCAMMG